LKTILSIGNILYILSAIIISINDGIKTDKFPITIVFVTMLLIPLILLIVYGLKAYQKNNDRETYFSLLAINFLPTIFQILTIIALIMDPELFLSEFPQIVFSAIMLLLWVLNIITYLNRGKFFAG
jgi:hypothetical protein